MRRMVAVVNLRWLDTENRVGCDRNGGCAEGQVGEIFGVEELVL